MRAENPALAAAYAACERLARAHYENFPVASRLLPRRMRPHVAAIYAFARSADDVADEDVYTPAERHRLLDAWHARLHACVASSGRSGSAPGADTSVDGTRPTDEAVCLALGRTIRECGLPLSLFEDLLSAFRQDITTHRYDTWNALLDYCRGSANPVGRLVLRVAGYGEPRLDRASDDLCTALQLTNFWQDVARDWQRGRLYVPLDDCRACGASEADLDARQWTAAWRCALERVARRTRALFADGRAVCDMVPGRLRLELRLTWLGGVAILDRLEQTGFDVFRTRPSLGAGDAVPLLWRATIGWRKDRDT